ncbi:MAG TPA: hypothetical protein VJT49_03630 [Amycolatopsis sp.]|uniref:hypothetical protein n=1 Tax=Amycolatopsis sp. TaxID=37632 RepID=UPI002B4A2B3A|nr:hypothetical protein [Amycolatopsis sp.]HKS44200.1 hypothetical protein [Amycolatopsis sp.]
MTTPDTGETPEDAVRVAAYAAAALGVPGLLHPGIDEAGLGAIWLTMVTTIAKRCGTSLSSAASGKTVAAALSSVAVFSLGAKVLNWAMMGILIVIPGVAIPAAAAMNAGLNVIFTCRLGRECIERFSDPDFANADLVHFGRRLIAKPSRSELADIRRVLVGDNSSLKKARLGVRRVSN